MASRPPLPCGQAKREESPRDAAVAHVKSSTHDSPLPAARVDSGAECRAAATLLKTELLSFANEVERGGAPSLAAVRRVQEYALRLASLARRDGDQQVLSVAIEAKKTTRELALVCMLLESMQNKP